MWSIRICLAPPPFPCLDVHLLKLCSCGRIQHHICYTTADSPFFLAVCCISNRLPFSIKAEFLGKVLKIFNESILLIFTTATSSHSSTVLHHIHMGRCDGFYLKVSFLPPDAAEIGSTPTTHNRHRLHGWMVTSSKTDAVLIE